MESKYASGNEELAAIRLREDEFLMHQFECSQCRNAISDRDDPCSEGQALKDALDTVWGEVDPPEQPAE